MEHVLFKGNYRSSMWRDLRSFTLIGLDRAAAYVEDRQYNFSPSRKSNQIKIKFFIYSGSALSSQASSHHRHSTLKQT